MFEQLWKRGPTTLIGLDIGSGSAKAVLLRQNGEAIRLDKLGMVPIPKGVVVDHEIKDFEAVGNAIRPLLKKLGTKTALAAAAVAGSSVITKVVVVEGEMQSADLESQIEIEADHLIPHPIEEVSLDFEVLGPNRGDPSKNDVLLSASRTDNVESRIAAMELGGFTPKVIDVEAYALGRALQLVENQLPEPVDGKVIVLVDVGASMTSFSMVVDGETIFTREQPFGGEQFNQAVSSYYGLDSNEVEQAKLNGELPRNYTFEVLAPFQTQMVQQIRRTLQIFCTSSGYEKVDFLVLSGGSSLLPDSARLLTDELGIHTILANPLKDLVSEEDELGVSADAPRYMIACGLALRSFEPWHA